MKKILMLILISIVLFMLDNAFVPFLNIKTICPSLLFVFMVSYSIVSGKYEVLWLGIFTGMLQDIYFIDGFWVNTFVNMIVSMFAVFIGNSIFKEKKFIPVVSCFFLSVAKGMIIFLILLIAGIHVSVMNMLFTGIYNMILCIFMYNAVYRLCKINYMKTEWKF